MSNATPDRQTQEIARLVGDLFEIDAYYFQQDRLLLNLRYRFSREKSRTVLEDRLKLAGYQFSLESYEDTILLSLDPKRRFRIPWVNVLLFFLTLCSVYFVPVFFLQMAISPTLPLALSRTIGELAAGKGIEFTLALMSILFVHEMGHYVTSRRRGIITSWPYFIPAPNIIGTFGAVIKSKSPFWNRRDLIEVGASGPIAGWVVALAWLIYGFSNSMIISDLSLAEPGILFSLDGESILVKWLAPILIGPAVEGSSYVFTEAAFAGWVGLLVTAMNMLPIGQFDGGHVLYGLLRRRQWLLGWLAMAGLFVMGFYSRLWWVFAVLGLIFKVAHPPTLNDARDPGLAARVVGWIAIVILIISLAPAPFQ